ncbi:hypothetical protein [Deinococcus aluminii]|uniref:Uncharacterized protein n=1 Tax=Deinococcus aluminii TaxID=1656885 RepID=A0ABP9XJN5_9DEIO
MLNFRLLVLLVSLLTVTSSPVLAEGGNVGGGGWATAQVAAPLLSPTLPES